MSLKENPDDAEVDSGIEWFSRYLGCIHSINNKQFHHYAEKHGGMTFIMKYLHALFMKS